MQRTKLVVKIAIHESTFQELWNEVRRGKVPASAPTPVEDKHAMAELYQDPNAK